MADIDRYKPEDRRAVEALYRRVFGHDAADASRLRWDWQYLHNPSNPPEGPQIWLAREATTIVGQYATMPVRISIGGEEIAGSWGMDVMVAPERQRQGLGEVLFRTWDRHVGASLGLGLSEASHRLFQKLRWPDVGPVPCFIKPLTARAFHRDGLPSPINAVAGAVALPIARMLSRLEPGSGIDIQPTRRFEQGFSELWQRIGGKFQFAVWRDAPYLNWKYIALPHVRYSIVQLTRNKAIVGYAVYRHMQEPRGRVTLLVDFLADPDDPDVFPALLNWVEQEARMKNSDKIRCFSMHAGFRALLRRAGYFPVASTVEFVVKINARDLPAAYYTDTSRWHVTLGDSDQDR